MQRRWSHLRERSIRHVHHTHPLDLDPILTNHACPWLHRRQSSGTSRGVFDKKEPDRHPIRRPCQRIDPAFELSQLLRLSRLFGPYEYLVVSGFSASAVQSETNASHSPFGDHFGSELPQLVAPDPVPTIFSLAGSGFETFVR